MADLYAVRFDEILDVLETLSEAMDFDTNTHLQEAYEASLVANLLPPDMLRNSYGCCGRVHPGTYPRSPTCRSASTISKAGCRSRLSDGREVRVRAFGSRVLHIPAGNGAWCPR